MKQISRFTDKSSIRPPRKNLMFSSKFNDRLYSKKNSSMKTQSKKDLERQNRLSPFLLLLVLVERALAKSEDPGCNPEVPPIACNFRHIILS